MRRPTNLNPGQQLTDNLRLGERLGRGAFGEVWMAVRRSSLRLAVKVIDLESESGRIEIDGNRRVWGLSHPHITRLEQILEFDSDWALVNTRHSDSLPSTLVPTDPTIPPTSTFELATNASWAAVTMLAGADSLRRRLQRVKDAGNAGLEPVQLCKWVFEAATGLDFLHQLHIRNERDPIVHCDVKPDNIVLDGEAAVLCDFGLTESITETELEALSQQFSTFRGTPSYAAPEAWSGNRLPASDQYALAITYYELCYGKLPFRKNNGIQELQQVHCSGKLDFSLAQPSQREVLEKATSIEWSNRYSTCEEFANTLRSVISTRNLSRPKSTPTKRNTIAIIGGGFSGTSTAIRLLQLATRPTTITIFEARKEQLHGGLAYSSLALRPFHYLNIHAGRVSLFRERPDDFLKWAAEDADHTAVEHVFRNFEPNVNAETLLDLDESSPVPRLLYGLYLRHRLQNAVAHKSPHVDLVIEDHEVINIEEGLDDAKIWYRDGDEQKAHLCDVAVLATGLDPRTRFRDIDERFESSRIVFEPYSSKLQHSLASMRENASVLLIGSGLTAFDIASTISRDHSTAQVTIISRHGLRHERYPEKHVHRILNLPFDEGFDKCATADEMLAEIESAIKRFRHQILPEIEKRSSEDLSAETIPELVLKAIEPRIAAFIKRADRSETRRFSSEMRAYLTTARTSVVPTVYDLLESAKIDYVAGDIKGVREEIRAVVATVFDHKQNQESERSVDLIVFCTGFSSRWADSQLWSNMMSNIAVEHEKTGLGIAVGNNGKIVTRNGQQRSRSLYAVGAMRRGDESQMNGRVGAFTFSIGTIRNQALMTSLSILKHIENEEFRELQDGDRDVLQTRIRDFINRTRQSTKRFYQFVAAITEWQFTTLTDLRESELREIRKELETSFPFADVLDAEDKARFSSQLYHHALWCLCRLEAGRTVTDISRLSPRYAENKGYGIGAAAKWHRQKKQFKDDLIRVMADIGAKSVSLSLYNEKAKLLEPYIHHLRPNAYTPTLVGKNNAGKFASCMLGQSVFDNVFSAQTVVPIMINDYLQAIMIPDYNATPDKKDIYSVDQRPYPNLIVAAIVAGSRFVGVAYFEAPPNTLGVYESNKAVSLLAPMANPIARAVDSFPDSWAVDHSNHRFRQEEVAGARFVGSNLENSRFDDCTLNDANFTGAICYGTQFKGCRLDQAKFPRVEGVGLRITDCRMRAASFYGATLVDARFHGADGGRLEMNEVLLNGATAARTSFYRAVMAGASLEGAAFHDCSFKRADLTGAVLKNVEFERCTFDGADLCNVQIDEASRVQLPDDIIERFGDSFKVAGSS